MTEITSKSPRLLKRGDVVRVPLPTGGEVEEVVRGVSIILHLANGQDMIVATSDVIEVVPPEDLTAELQEVVEDVALQSL